MHVGRNDPCPCGSGKKYKKCCLRDGPDEQEKLATLLRSGQDDVESRMVDFVADSFGPDALSIAENAFSFGGGALRSRPDENQLFGPWFLYEWRPKASHVPRKARHLAGQTIAESYLSERGEDLAEGARGFIEMIASEPCSFYDVVETVPGRRITLRDIFRVHEIGVVERSASRTVQRGDILFARVVSFESCAILVGAGTVVIPPGEKAILLKLRKSLEDTVGQIGADHLRMGADQLRRTYFAIQDRVLNPPPMMLANTDGDPMELQTLAYTIPSAEIAFEALKSLAVGRGDADLLSDAVRDKAGTLVKVNFPWMKPGNKMHKSWDNTILGHVRIDETRLTIEVNSAKRATKARAEVRARLGVQVGEPVVATKSADELLQAANDGRRNRRAARAERGRAPSSSHPEIREALQRFMEAHWDGWISGRIPALAGKTPLEAVRDPEGREMVEALLIEAERSERNRPPGEPQYDVDRVRVRLGLPVRGHALPTDPTEP